MTTITHLPEELLQKVLAALSIDDIVRVARVSKRTFECLVHAEWHHVASSDCVWRVAAIQCGYTQPDYDISMTLEHYRTDPQHCDASRYLDGTQSFYELCRRLRLLHRQWGRTQTMLKPPTDSVRELFPGVRYLRPAGSDEDVWRIKLDHADRCVIVTGRHGGVRAMDVDSGELLWCIPPTETRRCPHLEWSQGYMIFDRQGRGQFEVWRSERVIPDVAEPRRGVYQRYAILESPHPTIAYRFQYPTLVAATADSHVLFFDVPSHFDDHFVFLVGNSTFSITILSRAEGRTVWHLRSHLKQYGEPKCYLPEPLPTTTSPCFQQQHVYPVATPPMMILLPSGPVRENPVGPSTWTAVHPDHESDTLVLLSQEGIMLFRHYSAHLLHGAEPDLIYLEFPLRVFTQPEGRSDMPPEEILPSNWGLIVDHFMPGQLAVGHGRVFMVHGMLLMVDLLTPSALSARYTDGQETVPFSVYRWTDVMSLEHRRIHLFPFSICSCVQMDMSGVYCVSTQNLQREVGTDPASFPPRYEVECHMKNSTMAMAFRFDLGEGPKTRPVTIKPYDDAVRAAEEAQEALYRTLMQRPEQIDQPRFHEDDDLGE